MRSTFEPSAHDKLAQAQYEEMLKARVLNQANAVYNEDQCHSCKFEVVISHPGDKPVVHFIIASLVVHHGADCGHRPDQFPASQVLLQSEVTDDVELAYESLVDGLRVKMTKSPKHADYDDVEHVEQLVNEL
ncbi:hypothetical protein AA0120_g3980 [Alternaria tenuissima]|nr:hypothetical protein AA0120_g3980 [Alternaria tenuissima]